MTAGYTTVKIGSIPITKLRKAYAGNAIRLTNENLSGDRVIVVHPLNAKAIRAAQLKGKGMTTNFSGGEIAADLQWHDSHGAGLHGGSIWSWLKGAAKTGYRAVKDNWSSIQPILTQGIDQFALPAAMRAAGPYAPAALLARQGLKALTGVGAGGSGKGSAAMKAKMAALRARKKSPGGSFLIH